MGTNYYYHAKPPCSNCGRNDMPRHIGKSSGGWCFGLHVYPEDGINTLDDWKKLFSVCKSVIKNEYDDTVPVSEMLRTITQRDGKCTQADVDRQSYCVLGPNGLLRHTHNAISHGDGTWDCITGPEDGW